MSVTETIQEILQGIDDAQYGRDMRQFIHKGIQKCYEDGSAGALDLDARESIEKILEIFGDVESGNTASKDYAIGDSLIYDGRLYKVITAIEEGDTLTDGTNIEETRATSNVSDIYEFTISLGSSRLFIIPAMKIMIFYLYSSSFVMGNVPFPILWGRDSFSYRNMVYMPVVAEKSGENSKSGTALFASLKTTSADDTLISLNVPGATGSDWNVKGVLVAPYSRLNVNQPFSSAVPLIPDEET